MPVLDAYQQARELSWRWLARRACSKAEIAGRLGRAGFADEVIASVLAELQEKEYLDDLRLAQQEVERVQRRGRGYYWATARLYHRGLSREVVGQVMDALWDADAELEAAREYAGKLSPAKNWEQITRSLQYRGFRAEVIARLKEQL